MEPVIVAAQPPKTTLSIDSVVYIGQNQIRRCVARNTVLYSGDRVSDQTLNLAPDEVYTVEHLNVAIGAVAIFSQYPIEVTLDDSIVLPIKKMLTLDSEELSKVSIKNVSTVTNLVRFTYML